MATRKIIYLNLIALFFALGCGIVGIPATSKAPSTLVLFTPIPTLTPGGIQGSTPKPVIPSAQATSTFNSGSFIPFFVTTSADNVNLRTEPGTLFPVSRLLAKGTRLQVFGHAPGGEWIYVQTNEHIYGWILIWLVNGSKNIGYTPQVGPQNSQLVTGRVADLSGIPVSGIGFAITQGTGANAPRSDATTDGSGQFYAYLPVSASGQWFVTQVSVSCTSNTMDSNCNCIGGRCGKSDPPGVSITLPSNGLLQFIWK
jgi:hypothetical protein